ncbi:Arylsulfatase B,Arylsulfatase J,Arylsulfatase I [Mytilus edulis]|uniref:Arylsulfatase B,Arylsulfatase J,Arylsulfatase I n=1 Tax=Mytilus edulis TaxID=6550 RepID=A0A8S3UZ77_MYTED|nr:Arylsulfatase B,Arylsulfatase J,Arylsulfatase I [Mytilus edulis]
MYSTVKFGAIGVNEAKYLPESVTLLPEKLKQMGYSTHMTGKWHLGDCKKSVLPTSRGFDSFTGLLRGAEDYFTRKLFGNYDFWQNETVYRPPEDSYNTDLFTQRAVEIIEKNNPKTSPLFLSVQYTTPHFPLQVPQKFIDMYPNEINPARQRYLGMVSSLDEGVGTIVDALEKSGHMDNTVFIFMSDNGGDSNFGASNLPLRGNKVELWEGGSKSVGFVYSPRFLKHKGCVHEGMMHAVDWFPTILDMAGFNKGRSTILDVAGFNKVRPTILDVAGFNKGRPPILYMAGVNKGRPTILDMVGFNKGRLTILDMAGFNKGRPTILDMAGFNKGRPTILDMAGFNKGRPTILDVAGFNK